MSTRSLEGVGYMVRWRVQDDFGLPRQRNLVQLPFDSSPVTHVNEMTSVAHFRTFFQTSHSYTSTFQHKNASEHGEVAVV